MASENSMAHCERRSKVRGRILIRLDSIFPKEINKTSFHAFSPNRKKDRDPYPMGGKLFIDTSVS